MKMDSLPQELRHIIISKCFNIDVRHALGIYTTLRVPRAVDGAISRALNARVRWMTADETRRFGTTQHPYAREACFTLVVHSTSAADVERNQERVHRFAPTWYITAIPAVAVLLHSVVAASENTVKIAYIGCAADGSLHARITTRPDQIGDSQCECIPNFRFLPLEGIDDESW